MEKHFEVKLRKSGVGQPETMKRTLHGLGVERFGKTVFLKDTPAIRGMVASVSHLVKVEEVK